MCIYICIKKHCWFTRLVFYKFIVFPPVAATLTFSFEDFYSLI